MQPDACPYCMNSNDLCRSHAIPSSFFRPMQRSGSGQAIRISNDDRPSIKSNDTGAALLLCRRCEHTFNHLFDTPADTFCNQVTPLYRSSNNAILRSDADPTPIAGFILSVIWRESRSNSPLYNLFKLNKTLDIIILNILKSNANLFELFSFKLSRISDRADHFTREDLSNVAFGPNLADFGRSKELYFVGRGTRFSAIYPKMNNIKHRQNKCLTVGKPIWIDQFDIFDDKHLLDIAVATLEKELAKGSSSK